MARRNDCIITDYAVNVAVTNGVTWNGALLSLDAAVALSFQMQLTNGAAGQWQINPTNVADVPGPIWYSGGVPNTQYATNGTMNANVAASAILAPGANGLAFEKCWLSFVPSASGNLYVAACIKRYAVS